MSDKPKCLVFGCTIPRGIPHEHPAGVSAVMRDPVAPLTGIERAELERLRASAEEDMNEDANRLRESLFNQARGMQNFGPGSKVYDQVMGTNYYVAHVEAPMFPGRKLRDALLMAGHNDQLPVGQAPGNAFVDGMRFEFKSGTSNTGDSITPDEIEQRISELALAGADWERPKCPPLVRTVGRFMAWIFGAIGVIAILTLSTMTAWWL